MTCEELKQKLAEVMEVLLRLSTQLRKIKAELKRLWLLLEAATDPETRAEIIAEREALTRKSAIVGAQWREYFAKRQEIRKEIEGLGCEAALLTARVNLKIRDIKVAEFHYIRDIDDEE